VPIAFVVLGLVFVIPLYLVRRKYGAIPLVIVTMVEVLAGAALAGTEGMLVPTAVGGAAAALILHLRALRRPDGHKVVGYRARHRRVLVDPGAVRNRILPRINDARS